ncbi:MAG: RNA polymerase sigma factor [Pyrinomonadaceae bacterium]
MCKFPHAEEGRTDEELVEFVLAGEGEVFARLYERYHARTYRLAYSMTGTREAAEDLTQEVFMRAYQKLRQFDGRSSFSTWFYRLTVNCCLNHRQRERKIAPPASDGGVESLEDARHAGRAESEVLRRQIQGHVHKALLSLKPELRLVVIMRDVEGLGYEQIAERMNSSSGTVGARLNRARKLLARKLEGLKGKI